MEIGTTLFHIGIGLDPVFKSSVRLDQNLDLRDALKMYGVKRKQIITFLIDNSGSSI